MFILQLKFWYKVKFITFEHFKIASFSISARQIRASAHERLLKVFFLSNTEPAVQTLTQSDVSKR